MHIHTHIYTIFVYLSHTLSTLGNLLGCFQDYSSLCCSVLRCVDTLQCVALNRSMFLCACCSLFVAVCCSVLQCVASRCSVLQRVAVRCRVLWRVAVCCSVLQCVAVCCSVLQCVAVRCSVILAASRSTSF